MLAIDYVPTYGDIDKRFMKTLGDLMNKIISNLSSSLSVSVTVAGTIYIAFMGLHCIYGRP
ncbi:hypothetical protein GCM10023261_15250 [Bartonella jaculi]|uniref:Uncharacterized protein n=1 Tax=Bartonella jaculi TaxID=686226 RepID=A0ABP9N9C5_9HYPH